MATWKKVIVSGSQAEFAGASGSFSGSFSGNGANLTGVTATAVFPTSQTTPILSTTKIFSNDGSNTYVFAGQITGSTYAGVSGDITIGTGGVAAIGSSKVTSAMIVDATIVGGDIASGTVTNANLVNSSITIGSTSTALGASNTTLAGLTSVTSTNFVGNLTGSAATASFVAVANVSGLGAGVATFLTTPSSANLLTVVTDETGTGALVFATSPTLVTPNLGTPTSLTLTNATGLPISTGVSGLGAGVATFLATPNSANLASALTDETGTAGSVVFSAGPTFTGTTNVAALAASGNVTIAGNLNVSGLISGSATYITSTNVAITDQFILLASGSGAIVDAGIIVQDAAGTGESFYWENNPTGTGRWAIASAVDPTSITVTAAEYNVTAKTAAGAPSGNPTYGGATNGFGQIYVNNSNSDIWIYA